MPNRILREGICSSDTISSLSGEEEILFYRLLVVCDDFGLMDARIDILKARCFPLKRRGVEVSEKQLQNWLKGLRVAGLIRLYECAGKPYLCVAKWDQHQRIRNARPRYPRPDESNLLPIDRESPATDSKSRLESESESNPNPKVAASDQSLSAGNGVGVVYIPLNDGTEHPVKQDDVDELGKLYPALDVVQTLREIRGWNIANSSRRKTKTGVMRHVHAWFAKEQNKAPA
jgi:hypothetical protein